MDRLIHVNLEIKADQTPVVDDHSVKALADQLGKRIAPVLAAMTEPQRRFFVNRLFKSSIGF